MNESSWIKIPSGDLILLEKCRCIQQINNYFKIRINLSPKGLMCPHSDLSCQNIPKTDLYTCLGQNVLRSICHV